MHNMSKTKYKTFNRKHYHRLPLNVSIWVRCCSAVYEMMIARSTSSSSPWWSPTSAGHQARVSVFHLYVGIYGGLCVADWFRLDWASCCCCCWCCRLYFWRWVEEWKVEYIIHIYKIAGCKKKGKIFKWKHSVIYLFQFKWKWSHMQMIFGMSVLAHVLSFISYLFPFILLQKVFCFLWSSLTFTTTRFWFERAHNLTHKCATLNRIYVYYRENIHIPIPHRIVPTARYTRNTNNSQQSRWILLSIISFIMWCIHKCVV